MSTKIMVVIAPGRSCTSGIAKGLHLAGWPMGDNLLEPDKDNPEGYYEDKRLIELNSEILHRHKESWAVCDAVQSIYQDLLKKVEDYIRSRGPGQWGMKESTLVLTWPYFEIAFNSFSELEPIIVTATRSPKAVVESGKTFSMYPPGEAGAELVRHYQNLAKSY